MTKKPSSETKSEEVWNRIFPLKVGDRVEVTLQYCNSEKIIGRTGIVIRICPQFRPFIYDIEFDPLNGKLRKLRTLRNYSLNIFKREELKLIEKTES